MGVVKLVGNPTQFQTRFCPLQSRLRQRLIGLVDQFGLNEASRCIHAHLRRAQVAATASRPAVGNGRGGGTAGIQALCCTAAVVDRDFFAANAATKGRKPIMVTAQWVNQLSAQTGDVANLNQVVPKGAVRCEPVPAVVQAQVEAGVALEVCAQVQPQLQVVGAPIGGFQIKNQAFLQGGGVRRESVVHLLVVAVGGQLQQVALEHAVVDRVPWSGVDQALKLLRLGVAHTVKPNECQRTGQRVCAGFSAQLPLGIGLGLDGEAGQGLAHGGGVGSAQFGYAGGFAEVG